MSVIAYLIYLALAVYAWLIVGQALLSWLRPRPGSALFRIDGLLYQATEPYVGRFRRLLPMARIGGLGIDLSPFVALVVLFVAMQIVVHL